MELTEREVPDISQSLGARTRCEDTELAYPSGHEPRIMEKPAYGHMREGLTIFAGEQGARQVTAAYYGQIFVDGDTIPVALWHRREVYPGTSPHNPNYMKGFRE